VRFHEHRDGISSQRTEQQQQQQQHVTGPAVVTVCHLAVMGPPVESCREGVLCSSMLVHALSWCQHAQMLKGSDVHMLRPDCFVLILSKVLHFAAMLSCIRSACAGRCYLDRDAGPRET
jgi:hypothetical protein